VEIPRGSRNKYEYDEKRGLIRLNRVLRTSLHYPTDYGFILGTRAPDRDRLDALVVVEEPTVPGCLVTARPIGALLLRDEGREDHKILTVPLGEPRFADVQNVGDLAPEWLREIETFFATYKSEGQPRTEVLGWRDANIAWQVIAASTSP